MACCLIGVYTLDCSGFVAEVNMWCVVRESLYSACVLDVCVAHWRDGMRAASCTLLLKMVVEYHWVCAMSHYTHPEAAIVSSQAELPGARRTAQG